MKINVAVAFFFNYYTLTHCWQFFTTFTDLVLTNSYPDEQWVHSEYRFGDCKSQTIIFYTHVHLDSVDILGKIIIRGWLDLIRIPTCIILRAKAYAEDMIRSTAFQFQMCVPRITYCHTHRRFKYYYYEWYIPPDYIGGMDWELYFFGPEKAAW